LRLFAVSCCRCSRQLLLNKDFQHALEISIRFADEQATVVELATAYQRSNNFACGLYHHSESEREIRRWAEATAVANATRVVTSGYHIADFAKDAAWMIHRAAHRNPNQRLAELLRDIFGNPFRSVAVDPFWLTWNGGTVPKLAQAIYDECRFQDLPVLADALEEADCADADLLGHCRGPGPHVRGCWAVDLLLGKS
jgi:hypothetical protein